MSGLEATAVDSLIPWRDFPTDGDLPRYPTEEQRLAAEEREHRAITSDDLGVLSSLWNDPDPDVRGGARSQQVNPVAVLGEAPILYANPGGREKYANAVFSKRVEIATFIEETDVGEVLPEVEALTMDEFAEVIRGRFAAGGQ
jgi:hypothetical protein